MILFFYNLALLVALVAGSPWWLWRMATAEKYRAGLRQRLWKPRLNLHGMDASGAPDRRLVIWLHAVSVGEVLAVSRLVRDLDSALPAHRIVISTTTRTGHELACGRFGASRVFYSPLDLPWAVRNHLNVLRPSLLVLAETEFWPNLLHGCFRRGIPVAVVNARISDRSWPRYRRLRWLWRPILSRLSHVLAQSETDAERLKAIGCLPERVSVAGNLKFDVRVDTEADAASELKRLACGLRLVVAGSTLEGEEAALLESWPRVIESDPQLAMILAPRHPERFRAVAALLETSGASWIKRSAWQTDRESPPHRLVPGQIVLLDTIGELASVYSLAAAAFIGGSLVPAGGHNPLEPAQFGVPIVIGPHYANFRAIVEELLVHQAIRIAGKENLAATLIELLGNLPAAEATGSRAREVFERQAGATERCVKAIRNLLKIEAAAEYPK
jgi:3-deoxy-D-manno-octulosonic-acid transferase